MLQKNEYDESLKQARQSWGQRALPYLFVAPALILFVGLLLYPMVQAISYSFFTWEGTNRGAFAPLSNYGALFTQEPYATQFPRAFWHNVLLFVTTMVVQNTFGLFIAVQLQRVNTFARLFRVLYTMPYLASPLVMGYLWSLMLSDSYGVVNYILRSVGLESMARSWLGEPSIALWAVIFVAIWQWLGFPILLYGAALSGVDQSVVEASRIDGANGFQQVRHILVPLIFPAIGTTTILTFISTMEIFPIVYALGGSTGNPAGATDVLGLLFYRTSFQSGSVNSIGISSALATILFLLVFVGSFIANGFIRRREEGLQAG